MPEEQNINGERWNRQVNNFLTEALKWAQVGASNVDVKCGAKGESLGLDSIFAYRENERSPQKVVLVEAKYRDDIKAVTRSALQGWVYRLLEKMEHVPSCGDFHKKFPLDRDAQFLTVLLAIWVNNTETYDPKLIMERLRSLEISERSFVEAIYVLENSSLLRFCAVRELCKLLESSGEYRNFKFYYPSNSSGLICDGNSIPVEVIFSDIVFFKAEKRQIIKRDDSFDYYDVAFCFYFGSINDVKDLRFIDLAIRDSGLQDAKEVEVYLTVPIEALRSQIEAHSKASGFKLRFHRLIVPNELPDWLGGNL